MAGLSQKLHGLTISMDLVVSTLSEAPQRHGANSVPYTHEARLDCVNSLEQELLHAQSTYMAQLKRRLPAQPRVISEMMGNTEGGSVTRKSLVFRD